MDHNRDFGGRGTRGYALWGCVPAGWCSLLQRPARVVAAVDVDGDGMAELIVPISHEQAVDKAWLSQVMSIRPRSVPESR